MKPRPIVHTFFASSTPYRASPVPQCYLTLHNTCSARPQSGRQHHSTSHHTSARIAPPFRPHVRYASAAAVARKAPPPKTSVPAKSTPFIAPLPQVRAKLNPPDTTYAPALRVPPRGSEAYVKYLWRCGRTYVSFYKAGVSNVRSTLRLAKGLREKARRAGVNKTADMAKVLTRAEWQIVLRSRADKLRLPAFGALLLVFGEWLPLMVMYLTPVVPEPCRIPSQVERQLRKAEERRHERERRLAIDAARLVARDRVAGATGAGERNPQAMTPEILDKADLYTLVSLDVRFGIQPRIWDWLFMTPPKALLRSGLRNRIEYLRKDDWAIRRDGGFQALNEKEAERACLERGIRVLGRKEGELRRELAGWFEG